MSARLGLLLATWLVAASGVAAAQDPWYLQDPANARAKIDRCLEAKGLLDAHSCVRIAADACASFDQNQNTAAWIRCSGAEADAWDAVLNEAYSSAMDKMDAGKQTALRKAQRAWVAYRDAACEVWYEIWRGGTLASQSAADCFLRETGHRAVALLIIEATQPE